MPIHWRYLGQDKLNYSTQILINNSVTLVYYCQILCVTNRVFKALWLKIPQLWWQLRIAVICFLNESASTLVQMNPIWGLDTTQLDHVMITLQKMTRCPHQIVEGSRVRCSWCKFPSVKFSQFCKRCDRLHLLSLSSAEAAQENAW